MHNDAHAPEHAPTTANPSRFAGPQPRLRDNDPAVQDSQSNAEALLRRTARGAGWVMAWRWGMRALGLVSTLILVRLIAPADFGIIALSTSFMQTIDGMLALGTEDAVVRERAPDRDFYDTAFTMNLLRGLSVTLLVGALAWPAAHFFDDARLGPVLLFVATLPLLDSAANIGAVDFRRDFAFHKEFAIMVLPKLGGIIAAITAAFLLRSYVAMLFGIAVNRTLRVVMSYVMHPYRPRLSLRSWHGLAGYSFWTWLLSLAILVRDRADSLMLGRIMNTAAVGFYSVGSEIAALPMTELIEPLGRAAFSGFAAARSQAVDAGETWLRLLGSAALLTVPAGVGLSLVAAPLVGLAFGPAWEPAVPVLRILSLGFVIMIFGHLSEHLLSAYALLGRLVGMTLVGAAVRVALLAALIPAFGLAGAATAAACGVLLDQALRVASTLHQFGIQPIRLIVQVWRPVCAAASMAGALVWTGLGWSDATGPLILVEAIALGGTVYAAVLACLWLASGSPAGPERGLLDVIWRKAASL
jgi:lipopolysaccharide exporter